MTRSTSIACRTSAISTSASIPGPGGSKASHRPTRPAHARRRRAEEGGHLVQGRREEEIAAPRRNAVRRGGRRATAAALFVYDAQGSTIRKRHGQAADSRPDG